MTAPTFVALILFIGILMTLPKVSSHPGNSRRGGKCLHITRYLESPENSERRRHRNIDPDEASVFQSFQDNEERKRFINFVHESPICTSSQEEGEGRKSTTPSADITSRIIVDIAKEYCVRLVNSGSRNIPAYCIRGNG